MSTIVLDELVVEIPAEVEGNLKTFRRWARSGDFPETGRICFLDGTVWVDMSKEQFFSHNQVKNEFNVVLGGLVKDLGLGRYVPDGMLLSNEEANLSAQPDGAFIARATLQAGKVRLVEGAQEGVVELDGAPDMVLEVVSPSSVEKDTVTLWELYWKAGIAEYWLVDARADRTEFDILRHGPRGFAPVRKKAGWLHSAVFARFFRLSSRKDSLGHPEYQLKARVSQAGR